VSDNLRFADSVVEFGMIPNESVYRGTSTLKSAASLALSAKGEEEDGYRIEMIRLITTDQDLREFI